MPSDGDEIAEPGTSAYNAARKRRRALADAVTALEFAASSPAAVGLPWWERLSVELHAMRDALMDHIHEVEGRGGLMVEVVSEAPHLMPVVEDLKEEHGELCEEMDLALDIVGRDQLEASPELVPEARAIVVELMTRVSRHRQRGSDLVYDAYGLDIAGH